MTRKKYHMNIPGLSGIISYKRNYLIVAEEYKVVVYDLETLDPITKLSIRNGSESFRRYGILLHSGRN